MIPACFVNWLASSRLDSSDQGVEKRGSNPFTRTACAALAIAAGFKQGLSRLDTGVNYVGTGALSLLSNTFHSTPIMGLTLLIGLSDGQNVSIKVENASNDTDKALDAAVTDFINRLKTRWQGAPITSSPQRTIMQFPKIADYNLRPCLIRVGDEWAAFGVGTDPSTIVGTFFDGTEISSVIRQVIITQNPLTKVFSPKGLLISDSEIVVAWSEDNGSLGLTIVSQKVSTSGALIGERTPLVVSNEDHHLLRDISKHPTGGVVLAWETFSRQSLSKGIAGLQLHTISSGAGISLQVFDSKLKAQGPVKEWKEKTEPGPNAPTFGFPRLGTLKSGEIVLHYVNAITWKRELQVLNPDLSGKGDLQTSEFGSFAAVPALSVAENGEGFATAWHGITVYSSGAFFQLFDKLSHVSTFTQPLNPSQVERPGYPDIVATNDGGAAMIAESLQGLMFIRADSLANLEKKPYFVNNGSRLVALYPVLALETRELSLFLACWLENGNNGTSQLSCRSFSSLPIDDAEMAATGKPEGQIPTPDRLSLEPFIEGSVGFGLVVLAVFSCCVAIRKLAMRKQQKDTQLEMECEGVQLQGFSSEPLITTKDTPA